MLLRGHPACVQLPPWLLSVSGLKGEVCRGRKLVQRWLRSLCFLPLALTRVWARAAELDHRVQCSVCRAIAVRERAVFELVWCLPWHV